VQPTEHNNGPPPPPKLHTCRPGLLHVAVRARLDMGARLLQCKRGDDRQRDWERAKDKDHAQPFLEI